jgi:hypothetical protein
VEGKGEGEMNRDKRKEREKEEEGEEGKGTRRDETRRDETNLKSQSHPNAKSHPPALPQLFERVHELGLS